MAQDASPHRSESPKRRVDICSLLEDFENIQVTVLKDYIQTLWGRTHSQTNITHVFRKSLNIPYSIYYCINGPSNCCIWCGLYIYIYIYRYSIIAMHILIGLPSGHFSVCCGSDDPLYIQFNDSPFRKNVIFHSYVKLPEGLSNGTSMRTGGKCIFIMGYGGS